MILKQCKCGDKICMQLGRLQINTFVKPRWLIQMDYMPSYLCKLRPISPWNGQTWVSLWETEWLLCSTFWLVVSMKVPGNTVKAACFRHSPQIRTSGGLLEWTHVFQEGLLGSCDWPRSAEVEIMCMQTGSVPKDCWTYASIWEECCRTRSSTRIIFGSGSPQNISALVIAPVIEPSKYLFKLHAQHLPIFYNLKHNIEHHPMEKHCFYSN